MTVSYRRYTIYDGVNAPSHQAATHPYPTSLFFSCPRPTMHVDAITIMSRIQTRTEHRRIGGAIPRTQRVQMVTSVPGPHGRPVLTPGITTSGGAEVCARIAQE